MQALGDRVIVREVELPERSSGGVFLPHTAREEQSRGEVLSIGKGVRHLAVGDHVIYTKFDGDEYTDENGQPIVILREPEILTTVIDDA